MQLVRRGPIRSKWPRRWFERAATFIWTPSCIAVKCRSDAAVDLALPPAATRRYVQQGRTPQPLTRHLVDFKSIMAGGDIYRCARARDEQSGAVAEQGSACKKEHLLNICRRSPHRPLVATAVSRGGVDASTRRRLQADGLVARQAAQGRRVRVQQGSLDAVEAMQVHEVPQQGVRHHMLRGLLVEGCRGAPEVHKQHCRTWLPGHLADLPSGPDPSHFSHRLLTSPGCVRSRMAVPVQLYSNRSCTTVVLW